jgi:hypothetical protein
MMFFLKILYPKNIFKIIKNPNLVIISIKYILKRIFFDLVFLFQKKHKYKIIFLAGMPMSATTLVKNMFAYVPGYFTRYMPIPFDIEVNQNISQSAFRYCPRWSYTLVKTHLNPKQSNIDIIKKNKVEKVIVTYRDLRDVAIARYNRLLKFPKTKSEKDYFDYKTVNKEDGLEHSILVVSREFPKWIFGWFEVAKKYKNFVHFCKFEDLIVNRDIEFKKMLKFYDLCLTEDEITKIVDKTKGKKSMEENLKNFQLLPLAYASNFRSGKIGSWKDEFTSNNKNTFKKELGNTLIKLGYEKNLNW